MATPLISILIPARSEFPSLVHTIYSVLHCLEADGFDTKRDVEILVSNNCSDDEKWPQKATGGTTDFLSARGIYHTGILKFIYDPIAGNHKTTNKLAQLARGKYIFRSDAHMAYRPGFFKQIIETLEETKGLVHTGIHWMGTYPTDKSNLGIGYTLKLGEEWKGTWNNYHLAETWFYIPSQGHAGLGMNRKQFLSLGGYNPYIRAYGGGETYFDMKCWMLGVPVIAEPRCVSYHLSCGRGYSYSHSDYIHNVFLCGLSLGADMWVERAKINWLRTGRKEVVDHLWELAEKECAQDRRRIKKHIEKYGGMSFNDLLIQRPWEKLNDQRHGKHLETMLVYHPTWLELLEKSPQAKEAYEHSRFQKELDTFIRTHLWNFVYKKDNYAQWV